jgi:septal ring factor EnvC (AmiA/AmiB activator)
MSVVNKYGFLLVFLFFIGNFASAQKASERLKREQLELERKIATTKSLAAKSKEQTDVSYEQFRLIDNELRYREQLLNNIDNQIRSSELKIKQKNQRISNLEEEIGSLKTQYSNLLLYAYKKRNKYGDLMYIFSASSVEEAIKRKLYLEKLSEIQQKQLRLIRQNMTELDEEIASLENEKKEKLKLADQKRAERVEIAKVRKEKERIYREFKMRETEVLAELKQQEMRNNELQRLIQEAIQREIAEEQRKLAEERRLAEEKRRRELEAQGTMAPQKEDLPAPFITTKEVELAGANFAANRGRLPWPVEKGTVSVDFGKQPHPTLQDVYTQNNGIDISTPKNAVVRAVFDGEVTTVMSIPGAGKVVIVKHGNFRSVYSNIQEAYVTKGTVVSTKTPIGSLLPSKEGNLSIAHFEIHEVKDGIPRPINPNLWIAR